MLPPLPLEADDAARRAHYDAVIARIQAVLADTDDGVAAMATVACELHHAFEFFHWTGFYRRRGQSEALIVGPYQGGHGCLDIPFARGVCGAAARTKQTQRVDDVHTFPDHIACASSTNSEIVIPVLTPQGGVIAVLDVDSDDPAAFRAVDQDALETLCSWLGARFALAA